METSKVFVFQTFFTNMAETLLQKLPPSPSKYRIDSVKKNYKNLNITTKFQLKPTTEDIVLKLLKNFDISKAAGLGIFVEDFYRMVQSF